VTFIWLLGVIVVSVVLLALGISYPKWGQLMWALLLPNLLTITYSTGKAVYGRTIAPFNLKLSEYVRSPDYKKKVGFLAEFEEDFRHLVESITTRGEPLVIFIDDIDRCQPIKAVEIIEAINILLDTDNTVFVVGMDSRSVSASIEAKYQSIVALVADTFDRGGLTLGQKFLEKIVQINFAVPRADMEHLRAFVDTSLSSLRGGVPQVSRSIVHEIETLIRKRQDAGAELEEAVREVTGSTPQLPPQAVTEAERAIRSQSLEDSMSARRAMRDAIPYLGSNPRKIKRFINLFRLQASIANRRGLIEDGTVDLEVMSKWLLVATRWPGLPDALAADPSLRQKLIDAAAMIRQSTISYDDPSLTAQVSSYRSDARVARWVDASDLIELLSKMTKQEMDTAGVYLYLNRLTSPSRSL
jgi:hypothetical protein